MPGVTAFEVLAAMDGPGVTPETDLLTAVTAASAAIAERREAMLALLLRMAGIDPADRASVQLRCERTVLGHLPMGDAVPRIYEITTIKGSPLRLLEEWRGHAQVTFRIEGEAAGVAMHPEVR